MARRRAGARGAASPILAGLLLLGCGGDEPMGEDGTVDDSGTSGDAVPHPAFGEPASGRLSLLENRTDDIELAVQGIVPGVTELLLDGVALGPLDDDAVEGRLTANRLALRVRGSLVSGLHRMTLRTTSVGVSDESEVVEVSIVSDPGRVPTATLDEAPALEGTHVLAQGHGDEALLVAITSGDEGPGAWLLPARDGRWDPDAGRSVALPGLSIDPEERVVPVAALRYGRTDADPEGRIRVAWRVGRPGTRIDVLDTWWETASPEAPPRASLGLTAARAGRPAEWAELRRPWLVPGHLLAELWAPLDVEAPRPGDHVLVDARVQAQASALDPAQWVSVTDSRVDLDAVGPAIDAVAAELGRPAPLTVRVDGVHPLVLELDPVADVLRARPTVVPGRDHGLGFADLPLATVLGAFGSRTVAAVAARSDGRLKLSFVDDYGDGGVTTSSLDAGDLQDLTTLSGELAPGSIDGLTVFVLPFGAEQPARVVYPVGNAAKVEVLDEVACDSVAVAGGGHLGTLPLACVRDGEVWLGSMAAPAP